MYARSSVNLISQSDSKLANSWVATLTQAGFDVARHSFGDAGVPDARVDLVIAEPGVSVAILESVLGNSLVPKLVMASTSDLLAQVLPLLNSSHDIALPSDDIDVVAWRLRHLAGRGKEIDHLRRQLDPLTGLLNRHALFASVLQSRDSSDRGEVVGLLLIDIDHFRLVNATFGRTVGDYVLRAIGEMIQEVLLACDCIGRVGGDEFACLIARPDEKSILEDSERLLEAINCIGVVRALVPGGSHRLHASAGLALVRSEPTLEQLFLEAETALMQAKGLGGNQLIAAGRRLMPAFPSRAEPGGSDVSAESMTMPAFRRLIAANLSTGGIITAADAFDERYLASELPRAIEAARQQGQHLAVAVASLNGLRELDAAHGRWSSDKVLRLFACIARAHIRTTSWLAIYGSDRYVIVMPDTDPVRAAIEVNHIRRAFASSKVAAMDGSRVAGRASFGIAQLRSGTDTPADLLGRASEALRQDGCQGDNRKVQGRDSVLERTKESTGWPLIQRIAGSPQSSSSSKAIFHQRDQWHRLCKEWLEAYPCVAAVTSSGDPRRLIESIANEAPGGSIAETHLQRDNWQLRCSEWLTSFPASVEFVPPDEVECRRENH